MAPEKVVIEVMCATCGSDAHGKPYLPSFPNLSFNLSHSGDYVAVVVADGYEVGVDLEEVPARVMPTLWETIASRRDHEFFGGAPDWIDQISLWVRKEAVLKATGRGLDVDFRLVDIDSSGRYLSGSDLDEAVWVQDVAVKGAYRCSVAMVGSRPIVSFMP